MIPEQTPQRRREVIQSQQTLVYASFIGAKLFGRSMI